MKPGFRPTSSAPLLITPKGKNLPSGMNKDGWGKDTNARWRWRWRGIVDRRRHIDPLPVAIRPIHRPSPVHSPVALIPRSFVLIPRSSLLVTALVMFPIMFVIFGEGRRHVYAADHCSQGKPHHDLAHYGSEIP